MKRIVEVLTVLVMLGAHLPVLSAEIKDNSKKLAFLEGFIGDWKVVTTEGSKEISVGMETSEWIWKGKFMRHLGWGQYEGENVQYGFCAGWNPVENKPFQWGFGGNASGYGIMYRIGSYDKATRVWNTDASTILWDGAQQKMKMVATFVNKNRITLDFKNRVLGDEQLPDHRDVFERNITVESPDFDETPGPAYEHLKYCDYYEGNWDVTGTMPNGTKYKGGETNRWVVNRNFMHTVGWGQKGQEPRVDYELVVGWDPVMKNVTMWSIDSTGAFAVRKGAFDANQLRVVSEQTGTNPDGTKTSASVIEQYVDNDTFKVIFADQKEGEKELPDFQLEFGRVSQ